MREFPQSEDILATGWTMSVEAEQSGMYNEVMHAAQAAFVSRGVPEWAEENTNDMFIDERTEEEVRDDEQEMNASFDRSVGRMLASSKLYTEANEVGKVQILRALRGNVEWVYTKAGQTDGLFDGEGVGRRLAADNLSRYVLSGLLGEELLEENKSVRRVMWPFEGLPLDRAILVGGAALARYHNQYDHDRFSASYISQEDDGFRHETLISTNGRHGDFRAIRYERPVRAVTTTLDSEREHYFMPIPGGLERSAMYHSGECGLMRALLTHAVLGAGVDRHELHKELLTRIHAEGIQTEFEDSYEHNTHAGVLAYTLDNPEEYSGTEHALMRARVDPSFSSDELVLYSTETGVRFDNEGAEGGVYSRMHIPNAELVDYMMTMLKGMGGSPSKRTMIEVIQALRVEDAV